MIFNTTLSRVAEEIQFGKESWRGFQKICCNSEAALAWTGLVHGSCPETASGRWQKSEEGHQDC